MTERPRGVLALALIFIIIAVAGIILEVYLLVYLVPAFQNQAQNDSLFALIGTAYPALLGPFSTQIILLILLDVPASLSSMNTYFYSALLGLIYSGVLILSGVGFIFMKKWAYYLGLLIGVADLIGGILLLIFYIGILFIAAGIIILVYLMYDVRYAFE
jgi:hypothetical protein